MTVSATGAGRRPRLPKGEGRQLRDEILEATERLLLETGSGAPCRSAPWPMPSG